jgi:hypothetical protein
MRRPHARRRVLVAAIVIAAMVVGAPSSAQAYFAAPAASGAAASAAATTIGPAGAPSATVLASGAVSLAWSDASYGDGVAVSSYRVERFVAESGAPAVIVAGCDGVQSSTSCTEPDVPEGRWTYRVTPVAGLYWQGPPSSESNVVTIGNLTGLALDRQLYGGPDFATSGSANVTGTLANFGSDEPLSFHLDSPFAPALEGSPATANVSGGASIEIVLPKPSDGPHRIYVVGGFGSQAWDSFVVDATAPTGVLATPGAFVSGSGITYARSPQSLTTAASDPIVNGYASSVASVSYHRCAAPCTPVRGAAGTTLVGASSISPYYSVTWQPLPSDGGWNLIASVQDKAGNSTISPMRTVHVDSVPPTTTDDSGTIGSAWSNVTRTVTLSPTDSASGVLRTHWTSDGSAPSTDSAQGTSVGLATDGLHTVRYFSIDNVGNQEQVRTAATQVRIDLTGPTVPAPELPATISAAVTLASAATDPVVNGASSGVASVGYYYCAGVCTPTVGAAGTTLVGTSTTEPSYSITWSTLPADGTYSVAARALDVAGNATMSAAVQVSVDGSGPTISATMTDADVNVAGWISASDTYHVYANVSDPSGVSGTVSVNVTAQSSVCSGACSEVTMSTVGGPWSVMTATGAELYHYRSAMLTTVAKPGTSFSVTAQDTLANVRTASFAVAIDAAKAPPAPTNVELISGRQQTAWNSCTQVTNGYLIPDTWSRSAITVTTGNWATTPRVVRLFVSDGTNVLTFTRVLASGGVQPVAFTELDLSDLANSPSFGTRNISMTARELTAGGNAESASSATVTVTKWSQPPVVNTSLISYLDDTVTRGDRVSGSSGTAGPSGFVIFRLALPFVAGPYTASTNANGNFNRITVAAIDGSAGPVSVAYTVTTVDGACNQSTEYTFTAVDTK